MSPCLSKGGKAYGFELGVMKSSSTSTRTSNNSSSPSSTLSESSNSPIFVCTRKPRTQRKRPNQKYNEAAALLSTAYPNVFSNKNLWSPPKFSPDLESTLLDEPMELLLPFQVVDKSEFLLNHNPVLEDGKLGSRAEPEPEAKLSPLSEKPCQSPGEIEIQSNPMGFFDGCLEDFDAESILDEDIEDGILDTIMGDLCVDGINDYIGEPNSAGFATDYGRQFDIGFGFGKGIEANALRNVQGTNNWWDFPFPTVDIFEISPTFGKSLLHNPVEKKKKKKNIVKPGKPKEEPMSGSEPVEADPNTGEPNPEPKQNIGLLLKLNYDGIVTAWSGRGSPFSDEGVSQDMQCADIPTRLAQIDLFPDAGAVREASVQRYKEKRRSRLFSKKIRYEVRKVNADQRPRMKGRFVRQQNSSLSRKR